jgi:hypothetical protein
MDDTPEQANPLPQDMMAAQQRGPTVWEMCRLLSGIGIRFVKDWPGASVMKTGEHVGFISNQLLPGFRPALLWSGMR